MQTLKILINDTTQVSNFLVSQDFHRKQDNEVDVIHVVVHFAEGSLN